MFFLDWLLFSFIFLLRFPSFLSFHSHYYLYPAQCLALLARVGFAFRILCVCRCMAEFPSSVATCISVSECVVAELVAYPSGRRLGADTTSTWE